MNRRNLYLIRHGDYDRDDSSALEGKLTDLGREQAHLTTQRLATLPVSAIFCSTLHRASETATILAQAFPNVRIQHSQVLCECIPCVPPAFESYFTECTPEELARGAQQSQQAFSRYFRRPRAADRHELLVGHGNLIRYLICRALQLPPETWVRFGTNNCGISQIAIRSNGLMTLESHNDIGHLPAHLHTG